MGKCSVRTAPLNGIVFLFLIFASLALADDQQTAGFTNGRGWNGFPAVMKVAYLSGLSDGSNFIVGALSGKDNLLFLTTMTFGDVTASLDSFFKEPTNANIPVTLALLYVRQKAEGASEAELKALESKMRKQALDILRGR